MRTSWRGRTDVSLCLAFCEVCRGRIWINACVAAGDDEFDIPALKRYQRLDRGQAQ